MLVLFKQIIPLLLSSTATFANGTLICQCSIEAADLHFASTCLRKWAWKNSIAYLLVALLLSRCYCYGIIVIGELIWKLNQVKTYVDQPDPPTGITNLSATYDVVQTQLLQQQKQEQQEQLQTGQEQRQEPVQRNTLLGRDGTPKRKGLLQGGREDAATVATDHTASDHSGTTKQIKRQMAGHDANRIEVSIEGTNQGGPSSGRLSAGCLPMQISAAQTSQPTLPQHMRSTSGRVVVEANEIPGEVPMSVDIAAFALAPGQELLEKILADTDIVWSAPSSEEFMSADTDLEADAECEDFEQAKWEYAAAYFQLNIPWIIGGVIMASAVAAVQRKSFDPPQVPAYVSSGTLSLLASDGISRIPALLVLWAEYSSLYRLLTILAVAIPACLLGLVNKTTPYCRMFVQFAWLVPPIW
jgi:hypothetical protein